MRNKLFSILMMAASHTIVAQSVIPGNDKGLSNEPAEIHELIPYALIDLGSADTLGHPIKVADKGWVLLGGGFRWEWSQISTLDDAQGASGVVVNDMNNFGDVVGYVIGLGAAWWPRQSTTPLFDNSTETLYTWDYNQEDWATVQEDANPYSFDGINDNGVIATSRMIYDLQNENPFDGFLYTTGDFGYQMGNLHHSREQDGMTETYYAEIWGISRIATAINNQGHLLGRYYDYGVKNEIYPNLPDWKDEGVFLKRGYSITHFPDSQGKYWPLNLNQDGNATIGDSLYYNNHDIDFTGGVWDLTSPDKGEPLELIGGLGILRQKQDYATGSLRPISNSSSFDTFNISELIHPNTNITVSFLGTISDDGHYIATIGENTSSQQRAILLFKLSLECSAAAAGMFFGDEDNRITPISLNNPTYFNDPLSASIDPCDPSRDDPALVIFRDDVLEDDDSIKDFDVDLKVGGTAVTGAVVWTKVKGPSSGSLVEATSTNAIFRNPKEGGLYQFDVTIAGQSIRTSLLLPLAGADLTDWLQAEIASIEPWAISHRRATEDANYSSIPFKTAYDVYRVWTSISGSYFDYTIDPVDANELSPCRRFQSPISSSAEYGYVTLSGHVVHGSKINVMLWAIFGHYWGYGHPQLIAGSLVNELSANMQLDPQSTRYAIGLGSILYHQENLDLHDEWAVSVVKTLQEPADLIEEKLWPSPYAYDPSKSTLERPDPDLPTTP